MKKLLLLLILGLTGIANATDITNFFDRTAFPLPVIVQQSATSTEANSRAASTAYATNLVVKASAGKLCQLVGYNSKASAQFIQIYNSASLPSEAAVPIYTFSVPATSNFSLDFGSLCSYFSTGIVVGNSSTGPTKTIGSADVWFTAEYK
jgi:hypothetical protein